MIKARKNGILRAIAKRAYYERSPWYRGYFFYFGQKIYFSRGSYIFKIVAKYNIYEEALTNFIIESARRDSVVFDGGANIGLISAALLNNRKDVTVYSIEASPETLKLLQRTVSESECSHRWFVEPSAIGAETGEVEFYVAEPSMGVFDGILDTGYGGQRSRIRVPVTTLDDIWESRGRPDVSLVKLDIEGAESQALSGARSLISACRPIFIVEWNAQNLKPYGVDPTAILEFAFENNYRVRELATMADVTPPSLGYFMARGETFVLEPA